MGTAIEDGSRRSFEPTDDVGSSLGALDMIPPRPVADLSESVRSRVDKIIGFLWTEPKAPRAADLFFNRSGVFFHDVLGRRVSRLRNVRLLPDGKVRLASDMELSRPSPELPSGIVIDGNVTVQEGYAWRLPDDFSLAKQKVRRKVKLAPGKYAAYLNGEFPVPADVLVVPSRPPMAAQGPVICVPAAFR